MGFRVAVGSKGTPGDPEGISLPALGAQAAPEGHSLVRKGKDVWEIPVWTKRQGLS